MGSDPKPVRSKPVGSDPRGAGSDPAGRRVLVAMGGGSSAAGAQRIADAIADAMPDLDVHVARGFVGRRRGPDGLVGELACATVAVVAGGVTLYEACALGVPAVAVPLSQGQQITVRAIAKHGAAVNAGRLGVASRSIAGHVARLLADAPGRLRMSRAGKRLVDGRGAFRVAAAVRRLARTRVADVA